MNYNILLNDWLSKKISQERKEEMPYIHFDSPFFISKRKEKLKKELLNENHIIQHHFYPFIHHKIKVKIYTDDKVTRLRKLQTKKRNICYAGHYDNIILSRYAFILSDFYEKHIKKMGFSESPIAYRKIEIYDDKKDKRRGSSNIDFANEVFNYIKNKGECVVLTFDVTKFFDNLDWGLLKEKRKEILGESILPKDHFHIFKILTNFQYIEKKDINETLGKQNSYSVKKGGYLYDRDIWETLIKLFFKKGLLKSNEKKDEKRGIPQGSAISAVLSNLYMLDFDKEIFEICNVYGAMYRRYCDDIVIVCDLKDKQFFVDKIYKEINRIKLEIQTEKEDRTIFKYDNGTLKGFYDMDDIKNIDRNSKNKYLCINKRNGDSKCLQNECNFKSGRCKTIYKQMQYLGFNFDGVDVEIRPGSISKYYQNVKRAIRKTCFAAKSKNNKGPTLFKRKILTNYSTLGKRNFISYAQKCLNIIGGRKISQQLHNHHNQINKLIKKYHFTSKSQ